MLSLGQWPYSATPWISLSAPITPEYPTSMTLEFRRFSATRNATRKMIPTPSQGTGRTVRSGSRGTPLPKASSVRRASR